uniref:Osteoclast-stimulating factor 1 n=1 Tax=Sparus aurata TaxID=8175 RepID=A0A671WS43_SPAAU
MRDPTSTCSYNKLYQNVKRLSKNGEYFCKELMTVFQQRAELELNYAKGLQKLAGKLIRASKGMSSKCFSLSVLAASHCESLTFSHLFVQQLDSAIERTGKLVTVNWSEQLKTKKKLGGLTREHEALFNFVENNKQMCTEKEKQKMLNRLTKSAELQTRVDEEYFKINMEGHQMRLKLENTLKNCYQIIQELEKQRIEVLCNILNRYNLQMSSFGQTLKHGQRQIEQAVQRVDMDKDIQVLTEENNITADDNVAEFLMADYFEEDSKSFMDKDRRKEAIKLKLQRLDDTITKTKKDREGVEKLMKTYAENPSFSNQKNLEETEQQLDEITLKLDLLEATHYKLSVSLSDLEGTEKSFHRFKDSIVKWKDKDCEHSVVQLTRPVKLRRTPFRSRHEIKAMEKHQHLTGQITPEPSSIGQCKALYNFTPEQDDELTLKEGDLLDIYTKEENGWWFGELNGKTGHFPSTYVEELLNKAGCAPS